MAFSFSKTEKQIALIDVSQITASEYQPRKRFSDKGLTELAESVREHGVLQPILVVKEQGGYTVIAGERRLRASRLAGLKQIPAVILDKTDKECAEISLIENIQREQLSFFEEAQGYKRLINEFGYTQSDIAKRLSKKQSTISNKVRLLKLPATAQAIITANGLTERHARELLKLPSGKIYGALDYITSKNLNVTQTEQYIRHLTEPEKALPQRSTAIKDMRIFINTINNAVALIKKSGIKPVTELCESDGFVEYTIKIPKTS